MRVCVLRASWDELIRPTNSAPLRHDTTPAHPPTRPAEPTAHECVRGWLQSVLRLPEGNELSLVGSAQAVHAAAATQYHPSDSLLHCSRSAPADGSRWPAPTADVHQSAPDDSLHIRSLWPVPDEAGRGASGRHRAQRSHNAGMAD